MLIKYIKSVLWRAAKRLSYIEDAWCLKVNLVIVLVDIGNFVMSGGILFKMLVLGINEMVFAFPL